MNSHLQGERVVRDGIPSTSLRPADRPHAAPLDSDLEAAQRELASEHSRLTDALANAESALAMRDEVLAIVAHDLRTPLDAILTSVAFLMDVEHSEEERRRLLAVIRRSVSGMHRLIDDLLDVARMESGAFAVDLHPCDLGALARDVVEQFRRQAVNAGLTLECHIESDTIVTADRHRIAQVLQNLIGNALKFTPAGGRVTVDVRRGGTGGVHCSVADTGAGIAPDDLSRLFERFWQARRDRRGGAGLGLAIARGIVEAHGARLEVDSELGAGSTFFFHLT
ncbi:MAG: HAMP domain-containing histidine kinase [Gemmatimonadota bacterium]|nr:HAMP domain-containing histidine kinase [Gemmatimonadota bacterium]